MAQLFANNAISLLAHGISDIATSLDLAPGSGVLFPNPGVGEFFLITLEDVTASSREIIKVTGRAGDTLTFNLADRGQEGTIARPWFVTQNDNVLVELRATAGTMKQLSPAQILCVTKDPGVGEFSSVATALASITDNSSSKTYQIKIAPGIYTEPPIVAKQWVSIVGSGMDATILVASNPAVHFITSAMNDGLSDVTVTGATGAGAALLRASDAGTLSGDSIFYENIRFGDGDILVLSEVSTAGKYSQIFIQNARFAAPYQYRQGFVCRSVAGGVGRILVRNTTTTGGAVGVPEVAFFADGPGAEIRLLASQIRGMVTAPFQGVGVQVANGGFARVSTTTLRGFDKSIYAKSGGAAPSLEIFGAMVSNSNTDLHVEHSGTTGSFSGAVDINKVIIDPAAPISITYNNIGTAGGSAILGSLYLGSEQTNLTDVTDLIQLATPTGSLSGGVVTKGLAALTVDVTAGFGYVSDAVVGTAKRIEWVASTASVADNANNWIYVDNTGNIQSATSIPETSQNIVLARARTAGGAVVFISLIPFDATHVTAKQNDFLRNAIGPIFGIGMTVAENAVTARAVDISDGEYWYGTNKYLPTGGVAKPFNSFYHSAGNWTQTNNLTTIDNTQYDDGNNLQPLTAAFYVKHALYVSGDGVNQSMSLIYGRGQYASLLDAQNAALPLQPGYFVDVASPIAAIIVQQGTANIVQIIDIRPRIGFQAPSTTGAAHHGDLLGLDNDDHPQYLLANGTRAMTGNLNLGAFSINTTSITVGTASNSITSTAGTDILAIPGAAATVTSNGANLTLRGGPGGATSGNGGVVQVFGGVPVSGNGGGIQIAGANAQGANGDGGNVQIAAGIKQGTGVAGTIQLLSNTGVSGTVTISSLTANSFMYSGAGGLLSTTAAPTNGQLLIGSTGAAPVATTLTATANQTTITNGAGSITVGLASNPVIPGTAGMVPPSGTTAQRVDAAGSTRYNSTFNMLEYFNGTSWRLMSGVVIQKLTGAVPAGNTATLITLGNTAPLITDGAQAWSRAITPKVVTSVVDIRCNFVVDVDTNGRQVVAALFRGTTCIFSTVTNISSSGHGSNMSVAFTDTPGTTSAVTYSMRIGGATATTVYWASNSAGNTMGGTFAGAYSLEEKTI